MNERQHPWQPDTLVNVFSTIKTALTVCVLMLMDQGRLKLEDPLCKHWPGMSGDGREKITVKHVMNKKVITVDADTPIEEAARIMADKKIGGLPVVDGDKVVGMITETDLFKVFLELMGARDKGIRVTATIDDKAGELAKITKAIAEAGGNFVSFGFFSGADASTKVLTFKAEGIKKDEIKRVLGNVVKKFWDVRET